MAYIIMFLIIILDQVIKNIILNNFYFGQSLAVINNIFHITYVQNTGAAFGILKNHSLFFIIITIVIISAIIFMLHKSFKGNIYLNIYFGLILGGAMGNLIDRIRLGYVVDYLDFRIWPVFNLADSFIVIGSIFIMFYMFFSGAEL